MSSWARIQALQQEGSGIQWVHRFRKVSVLLIWISLFTILASPLLLKLLPIFQQAGSQKTGTDLPLGRSLLSLIPKADQAIACEDLRKRSPQPPVAQNLTLVRVFSLKQYCQNSRLIFRQSQSLTFTNGRGWQKCP